MRLSNAAFLSYWLNIRSCTFSCLAILLLRFIQDVSFMYLQISSLLFLFIIYNIKYYLIKIRTQGRHIALDYNIGIWLACFGLKSLCNSKN